MDLHKLADQLGEALKQRGWMLVIAESCTGGGMAQAVTARAGSSEWFERGFVTYSNISKQEMLGVRAATLEQHGAVSEQTVREMAEGALAHSQAEAAIAVSGIAGPGGATLDKPVGTVWLAWAISGQPTRSRKAHYSGNREAIQHQAVADGLSGLLDFLHECG